MWHIHTEYDDSCSSHGSASFTPHARGSSAGGCIDFRRRPIGAMAAAVSVQVNDPGVDALDGTAGCRGATVTSV